jgi:hypothetical protein
MLSYSATLKTSIQTNGKKDQKIKTKQWQKETYLLKTRILSFFPGQLLKKELFKQLLPPSQSMSLSNNRLQLGLRIDNRMVYKCFYFPAKEGDVISIQSPGKACDVWILSPQCHTVPSTLVHSSLKSPLIQTNSCLPHCSSFSIWDVLCCAFHCQCVHYWDFLELLEGSAGSCTLSRLGAQSFVSVGICI